MTITSFLATAAGAFLIGSIPTAYLLVKAVSGLDLRKEGSGNIGTLNAYEVSRRKHVGILVLVLDLIKGAVPVTVVALLCGTCFWLGAVAMIAVVLGHNYSPWIGFKGGRGLAPAAGAALVFNPLLLATWLACWGAAFAFKRNVHVGNIGASVLTPLVFVTGHAYAGTAAHFPDASGYPSAIVAASLCTLFLLRHAGPIRELLNQNHDHQQ